MTAPLRAPAGASSALLLAATLMVSPIAAWTDSTGTALPLELGTGSVLWLEGTSTVHEFECRTSQVEIAFTRDTARPLPADASGLAELIRGAGVRGVEAQVPVNTLRSGKDALDKNMRKAMKAEQHPKVVFVLSRYTLADGAPDDTLGIRAEGSLTIAGTTRPVTLSARAYRSGKGLWLIGDYGLRMSEYGIKPPTMMLGTLRVGDAIKVGYRLLLVPTADASPASSGH